MTIDKIKQFIIKRYDIPEEELYRSMGIRVGDNTLSITGYCEGHAKSRMEYLLKRLPLYMKVENFTETIDTQTTPHNVCVCTIKIHTDKTVPPQQSFEDVWASIIG